ncbi:hypothetical protein K3495_g11422 [Podosphaera aphanis]|nr:hypothetical protein K3495_g11422 [Podosphaera aphanis]
MSAAHTWDMLRLCWIDMYIGPPDVIVHDAGTNFNSAEFRQNASGMTIQLKCIPVEAPQSVGLIERYHGPLRRAFEIISDELKDIPTSKDIKLQMAVKSVNDSVGPNGLIPTLLVFGAFPRLSQNNAPSLSIIQRATAIKAAMNELSKLKATRQIKDALHQRNGPQISQIHDAPIGSDVLNWRVHLKKWTGPCKFLCVNGETCTVKLPNGPQKFRSTVIKIFNKETPKPSDKIDKLPSSNKNIPTMSNTNRQLPRTYPSRTRQLPKWYQNTSYLADVTIFLSDADKAPIPNFKVSRQKELSGLLDNGVFKFVHKQQIPPSARIFESRFVDVNKNEGTEKAYEKSRLVVQAYNDDDKKKILTQSPTIQRSIQRLILCLSQILKNVDIYLRDISQAYTQSTSS